VNRKSRQTALRSAILAKCLDGEVVLVDRIECPEVKTRKMVQLLDALQIYDTVLIALDPFDQKVWMSARNIPGVQVRDVRLLNAYDVLVAKYLLLTKPTFEKLIQGMTGEERGQAEAEGERAKGTSAEGVPAGDEVKADAPVAETRTEGQAVEPPAAPAAPTSEVTQDSKEAAPGSGDAARES
jgi:hypothetical protein